MRITTLAILSFFYVQAALGVPMDLEKESTYTIEVVVFENRLPELIGDELLARAAMQDKIRGLENALPAEKTEAAPFLYPAITDLLEQDGHFRLLAHLLWEQTVDAKSIAKPVLIASSNPAELEGTIRFFMSRHLHLDVNLLFRETVAVAGTEANTTIYRMSEQRKVKSQETNYFDHPRLGVLVRVMPVEKDKGKK